jgi:hypothetical protein
MLGEYFGDQSCAIMAVCEVRLCVDDGLSPDVLCAVAYPVGGASIAVAVLMFVG